VQPIVITNILDDVAGFLCHHNERYLISAEIDIEAWGDVKVVSCIFLLNPITLSQRQIAGSINLGQSTVNDYLARFTRPV
jgi:hypothetical protein